MSLESVRDWRAFATIATLLLMPGVAAGASAEIEPGIRKGQGVLAPHAPILIVGDSAFTSGNGVTSGNGTAGAPFIIAAWQILRNGTPGIRVVNTTRHFAIETSNVTGANRDAAAILLENVENATIRETETWNNLAGVLITSSRDIRVRNFTSRSTHDSGMRTEGGTRILVENSTFQDSGQAGVWGAFTTGFRVVNSTFLMSSERGVMVEKAPGFVVADSMFRGGRAGVEILASDNGTISSNDFIDGAGDAVFIRTGQNLSVLDNRIRNVIIGILAGNSRSNLIQNNTLDRCYTAGISFLNVQRNAIIANRITNTTIRALQLIASPNNTLRDNVIASARYGFDLQSAKSEPEAYFQDIDASNTIDGRPLFYARNATSPAIPTNAAYVALVNVTGASMESLDLSRQGQAAVIVLSSRIRVANSTFLDDAEGVRIIRSHNVSLTNITLRGTDLIGLSVEESQDVVLDDSTIAQSGSRGALVRESRGFTARDSLFRNNSQTSIQISYGQRFSAIGNRFDNYQEVALEFDSARDSWVEGNHVTGGITAFQIDAAYNTTVLNNIIEDVLGDGIYPRTSNRNTIIGNVLRRIPHPLDISLSNYNTVLNNTLEDVDVGIYFTFVAASRVENNTVRNVTFQGLLLERSPLLYLRNNRIENARYGADIRSDASLVESYWLDADTSNMINGRPLRYITNATSPSIPADTGFLGLVNVTGEVQGVPISNVSEGVLIAHSRDLVFRDATFRDTEYGPFVHASKNVTLKNVTSIRGLQGGVWLQESERLTLSHLTLDGSVYGGAVFLQTSSSVLRDSLIHRTSPNGTAVRMGVQSNGNLVTRNRIVDNLGTGLSMEQQTRGNHVYLNDFVNNRIQADDVKGLNWWNSSTRGNYWSDFNATDKNCDGAAETFYVVGVAGARDFRPLVKPVAAIAPPCAPRELRLTSVGSEVTLKWKSPTYDGDGGVYGYRVLRGPDPGNLTEIASVGIVLSYVDRGLATNRTFFYAVRAENSAGAGARSGIASARTWYIPPPRPDLSVEAVLVEPPQPGVGENVRLRTRIRNIGEAQAASGEVELLLTIGSGAPEPLASIMLPSPGLQPGAAFDVLAERTLTAGTHTFVARLKQAAPGEVNPANNEARTTFVVAPSNTPDPGKENIRREPWGEGPAGTAAGAVVVALILLFAGWVGRRDRSRERKVGGSDGGRPPRNRRGGGARASAGSDRNKDPDGPVEKDEVRKANQVKSAGKYVSHERKRKIE